MTSQYPLHPDDRIPWTKRLSPVLKAFCVGVLVILPLVAIGFVLKPFLHGRSNIQRTYSLPKQFSESELSRFLEQLASEKEFKYYFTILGDSGFRQAVRDIYPLLKSTPGKSALRERIRKAQAHVEQLALEVKHDQYPSQFSASPLSYPGLTYSIWNFIYEEFKATLLAVVYQSLYEHSFFFLWNNNAQEAAYLVLGLVNSIDPNQRLKCEQFFLKAQQLRPHR